MRLTEWSRHAPDRQILDQTRPPLFGKPTLRTGRAPAQISSLCAKFLPFKLHYFRTPNWAAILQSISTSRQGRRSAVPFAGKCESANCRQGRAVAGGPCHSNDAATQTRLRFFTQVCGGGRSFLKRRHNLRSEVRKRKFHSRCCEDGSAHELA